MKYILFALACFSFSQSFAASDKCGREAQRAAMAKYYAIMGTVQGGDAQSSFQFVRTEGDNEVYQVEISDQNDESEAWTLFYEVVTKEIQGRCKSLKVTSLPLLDLEHDLTHRIADQIHSREIIDLTQVNSLEMKAHQAYNILGKPGKVKNYKTLYIGQRKSSLTFDQFIQGMNKHVEDVRDTFKVMGLTSYQVYITGDYELAYQTWISQEAADAALASEEAKAIIKEAEGLLETKIYKGL